MINEGKPNSFFKSLQALESVVNLLINSEEKLRSLGDKEVSSKEFQYSVIRGLSQIMTEEYKKDVTKLIKDYVFYGNKDLKKVVDKIIDVEREHAWKDKVEIDVSYMIKTKTGEAINISDRADLMNFKHKNIRDLNIEKWFDELVEYGSGWLPKKLKGAKAKNLAVKNIESLLAFPVYTTISDTNLKRFVSEFELQNIIKKDPKKYLGDFFNTFEYDKIFMAGNFINIQYPKGYPNKRLLNLTTRTKQNFSASKKYARVVAKINKQSNDGIGLNAEVYGPNLVSFTKDFTNFLQKESYTYHLDNRFLRGSSNYENIGVADIIYCDREMLGSAFKIIERPDLILNEKNAASLKKLSKKLIQGIWLDFTTKNNIPMELQIKTPVGQLIYEDGVFSHYSKDYHLRRTSDVQKNLQNKKRDFIVDYIAKEIIFKSFKEATGNYEEQYFNVRW
ncbi:hypothetical protein K9L97_00400 [Candidatus Woesearchaeota archaeon]|nr:hypothetical protein [Candidatus Woesearchaeota archaeon]